jgi:tetratricopeptide (TPR) repeat protein
MIRTNCAACATPLAHTAPRCGGCHTRYCGRECQKLHWKEGGHKGICKKIKKAGGAEQYYADRKCAEAVAVAVEKCADDTKGQTCYICTEALHWKTKEGLVRMCACRGTAGFVHVSCLAEQAKILVAGAEENNLSGKALVERWKRWETCGLCKQEHHGVVRGALAWACWKTYVGRPETDWTRFNRRLSARRLLGGGLYASKNYEEACSVQEAELSTLRRLGVSGHNMLAVLNNLASSYQMVGRLDEALCLRQDVYSERLKVSGEEHEETLLAANNYATSLVKLKRFEEAKALLRKKISVARRVLGNSDEVTFHMRINYARALYLDPDATLDYFRESVTTLEETERTARRVLGGAHPLTAWIEEELRDARAALRAREEPGAP